MWPIKFQIICPQHTNRSLFCSLTTCCNFPESKKQIVLDGPRSCGKSIALAMLVHWARTEGWLVFYAPQGKEWTHGGFFYKNTHNGLWDTPIQANKILQVLFFGYTSHSFIILFYHAYISFVLVLDSILVLDHRVSFLTTVSC